MSDQLALRFDVASNRIMSFFSLSFFASSKPSCNSLLCHYEKKLPFWISMFVFFIDIMWSTQLSKKALSCETIIKPFLTLGNGSQSLFPKHRDDSSARLSEESCFSSETTPQVRPSSVRHWKAFETGGKEHSLQLQAGLVRALAASFLNLPVFLL